MQGQTNVSFTKFLKEAIIKALRIWEVGGGQCSTLMCLQTNKLGGLGACFLRKFLKLSLSEIILCNEFLDKSFIQGVWRHVPLRNYFKLDAF